MNMKEAVISSDSEKSCTININAGIVRLHGL